MEPEEGDAIEVRASPSVYAQIEGLDGVRVVMRPAYTDDPAVVTFSALATPAGSDAIRALGGAVTVVEAAADRAARIERLFPDRREPPA